MSLKGGELLIASRFLLARNLPTHYFKGFVGMSKTPKVMCQQISQGDKSLHHQSIQLFVQKYYTRR
jgi:hypothetical protein